MTTGNTELAVKARCAGLRHISFAIVGDKEAGEDHGDTKRTIAEIEAGNKVLDGKGCKK